MPGAESQSLPPKSKLRETASVALPAYLHWPAELAMHVGPPGAPKRAGSKVIDRSYAAPSVINGGRSVGAGLETSEIWPDMFHVTGAADAATANQAKTDTTSANSPRTASIFGNAINIPY